MNSRNGYVYRWHAGQSRRAHRLTWIEVNGEIADGLDVLHHCDVTWCDELTHLYLGTPLDNARDREARGRGLRGRTGPDSSRVLGVRNGSAKLDPDKVRAIRAARGKVSRRALAARYGVSQTTIREVQLRATWAEVDPA